MFTNDDWSSAEVIDLPTYIDLPAGNYDVVLDKVAIREATRTKSGYDLPPFVIYYFTVISSGEYFGSCSTKEDGLWESKSAGFVKRDIQRLGCVIPKNFMDIPLSLQNAIGKTINITVKVTPKTNGKGDLRNVYFNRVTDIMIPPSIQKVHEMNQISHENAQRLSKAAAKPIQPEPNTFGEGYVENEEIPF